MRPTARHEGIAATDVNGELVIYDSARQAAHCLDGTAGRVWRACDGSSSERQLAVRLDLDPDVVAVALADLRGAGLLEDEPAGVRSTEISRRQAMKRLGAAALIPAVVSIALPAVANAQSGCTKQEGEQCGAQAECCVGTCVNSNPSQCQGTCRQGACLEAGDPCCNNLDCSCNGLTCTGGFCVQ